MFSEVIWNLMQCRENDTDHSPLIIILSFSWNLVLFSSTALLSANRCIVSPKEFIPTDLHHPLSHFFTWVLLFTSPLSSLPVYLMVLNTFSSKRRADFNLSHCSVTLILYRVLQGYRDTVATIIHDTGQCVVTRAMNISSIILLILATHWNQRCFVLGESLTKRLL